MGAFGGNNPLQRKQMLMQKLMGRAMGGRSTGVGSPFHGIGLFGGSQGFTQRDSTNPFAVNDQGAASGHPAVGEYGDNPGQGLSAVLGGQVDHPNPSAVASGTPPANAEQPSNPGQPGLPAPVASGIGEPPTLVPLGDGSYFNPITGKIISGVGSLFGGIGSAIQGLPGHGYTQ